MDATMELSGRSSATVADASVETWRELARQDAPHAFRAIVRGLIEGAEGADNDPGNQFAAVLFARMTNDDRNSVLSMLLPVIGAANRDRWSVLGPKGPSNDIISAYVDGFVDPFFAASEAWAQDSGTVGDYLGQVVPADERRWRIALSVIGAEALAGSRPAARRSAIGPDAGAPRYVFFKYCISLGIVSFKRTSEVKVIRPGQSTLLAGLPYTLISLFLGWWGIPWGPIWTLESILTNLTGGNDVTNQVTY